MSGTTSEIYRARLSIEDRHWVDSQAYPPQDEKRHSPPHVMDFAVDARATYTAPCPDGPDTGTYWGVVVTNPPDGSSDRLTVDIPEPEMHYDCLVEALEAHLGHTGLKILVA